MKNFLQNWDYKKHALAVTAFYVGTAVVVNAFLSNKITEDEESPSLTAFCGQITKKQRIFNSIMVACYGIDMSATYLILNHFKKQDNN